MIHVCFGLHDKDGNYSKFTGTAMLSMFENTSTKITVHILHDNTLTLDNRDKFSYIAGSYGQIVKFYNIEVTCADKIKEFKEKFFNTNTKFNIGIMYRLLLSKLLSIEIKKIIYLDSDIIVNFDIKKFWQMELGDKIIAATSESEGTGIPAKNYLLMCINGIVKDEEYFNSGVLMINLEKFRQSEDILEGGIKFVANHPEYINFDQDVLNYCFSKNILKLPKDFNRFVIHARKERDGRVDDRILHYISTALGLGLTTDIRDPFNRLWFSYFEKTPWFSKETIGLMDIGLRQLDMGLKNIAVQLSVIMAGKERAFFATVPNITPLKNMFFIRNDEEIIPFEKPESFNVLLNSMKNSLGKKIFFLMFPEGYQQLRASLMQAGFIEGRDFINAAMFLSEAHGVPLNTYELIKVM